MRMSDKLSELSNFAYFALERRKRMKNFIIGGLVSTLLVYSIGSTYLLVCKGGRFNVRSR